MRERAAPLMKSILSSIPSPAVYLHPLAIPPDMNMRGLHWFADLDKLEELLEIPPGFLEHLEEEDDWSFVIKAHALIEAAVTQMVIGANDPRVAEIFRKLALGGGRTGKLAFAEGLGLVDRSQRVFIDKFSELRNTLVHDIRRVSFSFGDYFAKLPPSERLRWAEMIVVTAGGGNDRSGIEQCADLLLANPKPMIMYAVLATVAQALFQIDPTEYTRALEKAKVQTPVVVLALAIAILGASHAFKEAGLTKRYEESE